MDGIAFEWDLVRAFLTVLDAGSLSAAARRTGQKQPTLSRQIAALEAQLGVPLFERTGRGVAPTTAACAIASAARRMETSADEVARGALRDRARATGTVRIATSVVAASYLLPPVIASLQEEEPGIDVELVASNDLANLLRREADIAVRMVRPEQTSLVTRKLADIVVVACAHESYLARAGTPRRPEELLEHRLLGFDRDDTVLRGFAAAGLPVTKDAFRVRTDDQVAYSRLIASGAGIGFAAAYNVRHLPGVRRILPRLELPTMPCWLAVHREIRGSALIRRVYDHLARAIPAELART